MHCGKRELAIWLKHFVYWREQNLGVIENLKIVIFFGGQKEIVSNKENSPSPIRDFINKRSLKLTKILNLNFLKFDCQNLPFRHSLASSKLNPFSCFHKSLNLT